MRGVAFVIVGCLLALLGALYLLNLAGQRALMEGGGCDMNPSLCSYEIPEFDDAEA